MDWDYGAEEQERKAVIDRIWQETLGSSHTQDDSINGIKDDVPYEFKDPDKATAT